VHGTIGRVSLGVEAIDRYRYIQHLIASDFPPPARILELGSAPGDQIVRLAESGYVCTSVDIGYSSDEWSNGETGRMKRLLDAAGVAGIASDLEMTPYPLSDHSFDVVLMTEVYEHLRDYPIRSLHEVRRVLRRGGRLYFTTPNQAYIVKRFRLLMGQNVQTGLREWVGGLPFARHAREYTFDEIHKLMETANLKVVRSESRHFHLKTGSRGAARVLGKQVLHASALLRPTFGPTIVIVAEK
jgi:SAM-dependent methyltransferase